MTWDAAPTTWATRRANLGWTQADLAERSGVSKYTVGNYEREWDRYTGHIRTQILAERIESTLQLEEGSP